MRQWSFICRLFIELYVFIHTPFCNSICCSVLGKAKSLVPTVSRGLVFRPFAASHNLAITWLQQSWQVISIVVKFGYTVVMIAWQSVCCCTADDRWTWQDRCWWLEAEHTVKTLLHGDICRALVLASSWWVWWGTPSQAAAVCNWQLKSPATRLQGITR